MSKKLNLIGQTYGRLTVVEKVESYITLSGRKSARWKCKCSCGGCKITSSQLLKKGNTKSCGCIQKEINEKARIKRLEEESKKRYRTPSELKVNNKKEHTAWNNIKTRCNNPNSPDYWNYGEKGIKLCDEWKSFETFLKDVGKAPSKVHSIHRLDNNKDYEPSNVVWATKDIQSQIRSFSVFTPALIVHARRLSKQSFTNKEISETIDINPNTIRDVVNYRTWKNIPDVPPCLLAKTFKELIIIYSSIHI